MTVSRSLTTRRRSSLASNSGTSLGDRAADGATLSGGGDRAALGLAPETVSHRPIRSELEELMRAAFGLEDTGEPAEQEPSRVPSGDDE